MVEEILKKLQELQNEFYEAHKNAETKDNYVFTSGQVDAINRAICVVINVEKDHQKQ